MLASPAFTPAEATAYRGLPALGVKTPEERIGYLVKRGQLRCITILGRLACVRDHLDRFLAERQKDAPRKGR